MKNPPGRLDNYNNPSKIQPRMFNLVFTKKALKEMENLDRNVSLRVLDKLKWLAGHGDEVVHHQLTSLPESLKGLCRLRIGEWRALYWVYHEEKRIVVYGVAPRSEAYRRLP